MHVDGARRNLSQHVLGASKTVQLDEQRYSEEQRLLKMTEVINQDALFSQNTDNNGLIFSNF